MGLNTNNASGLTGGTNPANTTHTVRVLIGTYIQSVGRDVQVGEIVEISFDDFRFLNAYKYVTKDLQESEGENSVSDEAPNAADNNAENTENTSEQTTPATNKPQGKRR
jgi:hypothetical protein